MATFVFGKTTTSGGNQGFNGDEFTDGGVFDVNNLWDANEYDDLTGTATSAKFFDFDGKSVFELKGKGFDYVGETPIAGDVTTLNLKEAGLTQATVTGLTGVNLATLYALSGSGVFGSGDSFLFMAELFKGDDKVTLTAFDDVLIESWNDGNDSIFGLAGNDVLFGDDGNDILDGGTGADTMKGGKGDDTYIVDNVDDTVDESGGNGVDTVMSTVSFSLEDGNVLGGSVEDLVLTGSLSINGTGDAKANIITGNGKNNIIFGAEGGDTLDGGAGIDTVSYRGSGFGVIIVLNGKTVTNGDGGDADGDTIVNFENIIGSENNDLLTGDKAANILDGGEGEDTLTGGLGNDTYIVDNMNDIVVEDLMGGTDTVKAETSFSIETYVNVENLTLLDEADYGSATGNLNKNVMTGNEAGNVLDGRQGVDSYIGGDGGDTYVIDTKGEKITEFADEGVDSIVIDSTFLLDKSGNAVFSMSSIKNVENLSYIGTNGFVATGNALNNTISGNGGNDKLSGGDGNDTLDGSFGNDVLIGGDGNDTLDGSFDNDVLIGGKGDDIFSFTTQLGSNVDIITDFLLGADRIDLTTYESTPGLVGKTVAELVTLGYLEITQSAVPSGQSSDSAGTMNTVLKWDEDGGGDAFVTFAILEDFTLPMLDSHFVLL